VSRLNNFFTDRETEAAAKVRHDPGQFRLGAVCHRDAPRRFNFFNYVDRGDYSNSILHRSVTNSSSRAAFQAGAAELYEDSHGSSPTNERALAMCADGGDGESGGRSRQCDDQWFVNLNNNSANLTNQNGGFTPSDGSAANALSVADAIAALPPRLHVTVDGRTASSRIGRWTRAARAAGDGPAQAVWCIR